MSRASAPHTLAPALPSVEAIGLTLEDERARSRLATERAQSELARLRHDSIHPRRAIADSRVVRDGDLFLALPGTRVDGRSHAAAALAAGALAVLWESDSPAPVEMPAGTACHAVSGLKLLAGPLASALLDNPTARLWVAGVTGTNGKTSVSQWVAAALARAGRPAGVIGTLGIGLAGEPGLAINTTPEACLLQDSVARLLERGASALVMEASSIGIEQGRTLGVDFDCAVFTNLSRDHLDHHGDMACYAQAKARLFASPSITHVVCNLDDPFGERLLAALSDPAMTRIAYSLGDTPARDIAHRTLRAADIRVGPEGTRFTLIDGAESHRVLTLLVGEFNISNLLAVAGALLAAGLHLGEIASLLEHLEPVAGRMQRMGGQGRPLALVDYAHTPDALERALVAAKALAAARGGGVSVVFGCGGDRDQGKRAPMGEIAARLADRVTITSDNPRSESARAIIAQVAAGARHAIDPARLIIDRGEAIGTAIREAALADVVLVAGKGHESYQEVAGQRLPFSDTAAVAQALEAWAPC